MANRATILTHPAFANAPVENEVRRGRPRGAVSLAVARRRRSLDHREEERRSAPELHGDAILIRLQPNGDLEYQFNGAYKASRLEAARGLTAVLNAVLEG